MNANRETLSDVMRPTPSWRVETRTRLSSLFSLAAILFVMLLAAAPFVVSRGVVQDLFFILTMLALAQSWNLLAGYAGLISVGQQLFVADYRRCRTTRGMYSFVSFTRFVYLAKC